MTTFIIGGTSSIGTFLKPALSGFSKVITAGRKNCDVLFDLNNPSEKIIFPDDVDAIVHTAAHFGGNLPDEIIDAVKVNVLGTLKICHSALDAKAKHFILISSIYAGLNESSGQFNIYSLSKKHAEDVAVYFCRKNSIPLTILRPSPIYGIGANFHKHQPFFYSMIDKAEKGEDILLYGSHDPVRNYIYIDDLVNIIAKVIQNKIEGTYTCTQTIDVTYSQIAHAAFAAFNKKGTVKFMKDKPDISDYVFQKDDSLYKKINFFPSVSIEEGLKKIAQSRKGITA